VLKNDAELDTTVPAKVQAYATNLAGQLNANPAFAEIERNDSMNTKHYRKCALIAVGAFTLVSLTSTAPAQTSSQGARPANPVAETRIQSDRGKDAVIQVHEAPKVVSQMARDPGVRKLLQQARGVLIVPNYGRAGLGLGRRGGAGVLLFKRAGRWSHPAFFDIGGISAGAQRGIEAGSVALVLNTDKAVNSFMRPGSFSLDADAGLTIISWSVNGQSSAGKGDVVVWADTESLSDDQLLSISDVNFDSGETSSYYGRQVPLRDILNGTLKVPAYAEDLWRALSALEPPPN